MVGHVAYHSYMAIIDSRVTKFITAIPIKIEKNQNIVWNYSLIEAFVRIQPELSDSLRISGNSLLVMCLCPKCIQNLPIIGKWTIRLQHELT